MVPEPRRLLLLRHGQTAWNLEQRAQGHTDVPLDGAGLLQAEKVAPVLAAVGRMQFDVAVHRLEHEFGAVVELSPTPYKVCRRTDAESADRLRRMTGVRVMAREDGTLLALFDSPYWLERVVLDHPELTLTPIVVD